MIRKILLSAILILSSTVLFAQRASVSADLLKWSTLTPNVNVEMLLSRHVTLGVDATVNPFESVFSQFSTKQITISPEFRYYFKRPMYSHFLGVNLVGSMYDVGVGDKYYNGRMAAVGLVYGYSIYLSRRLVLTPSLGYGYGYFDSKTIDNGVMSPVESQFKPTITKLGLSFTYIIN